MLFSRRAAAFCLAALLLPSCADSPTGPGRELASLRLNASVAGTDIDLLVVTVSAHDIPVPLVFNMPVNDGVATGTLRVPPGSGRTFLASAFAQSGEISHEGSATVDVQRGPNPPLTITLVPRAGQVPVTIGIGSYSVIVTPAAGTVDAAGTLQLFVAVENAEGAPVPGAIVAWATSNPALATVDDAGLVTGVSAGTVQIMATYEGLGGASLISVVGDGPPPPPAPELLPETISAGTDHSCGLTVDGAAYCWGSNDYGQLGDPLPLQYEPHPVAGGHVFQQISAGHHFTVALTVDGHAYAWGRNDFGQLGNGTTTHSSNPVPVAGGLSLAQVSAGAWHAAALTAAGAAFAWGRGDLGQLGSGSNLSSSTPVPVSGGHTFVQISAGGRHTMALTAAGQAWGWGDDSGQLGHEGLIGHIQSSPVPTGGGHNFLQISAGAEHTVAITAAGHAFAWGINSVGQLGDGTTTNRTAPTAIAGGHLFRQISAGAEHTCAISLTYAAYCWGTNGSGKLGLGSTPSPVTSPAAVAGGLAFRQISAGGEHTHALTTAGAAYGWGFNFFFALGDGTWHSTSTPVAVAGGLTFK